MPYFPGNGPVSKTIPSLATVGEGEGGRGLTASSLPQPSDSLKPTLDVYPQATHQTAASHLSRFRNCDDHLHLWDGLREEGEVIKFPCIKSFTS